MKIIILFFISFIFLFSNIDALLDNFESGYEKKEKKQIKSNPFNKNIVMEKKVFRKRITPMNKTTSIDNAIKSQQYYNNKDDISNTVNMAIEEYVSTIIPLVIVIGLFIFLFFIMYSIASSTRFSRLKHKIKVLENLVSSKIENLAEKEDEDYDTLENSMKKMNFKITSLESINKKMLHDDKTSSVKKANNTHPSETISHKQTSRTTKKKLVNKDEFLLDDDFAMDSSDEELSLQNNTKKKKKQKITPVTDLTNLDMDIKTPTKKIKKINVESMEEFSLEDFDE
jgi:predicted PurR-regulated permease PerM